MKRSRSSYSLLALVPAGLILFGFLTVRDLLSAELVLLAFLASLVVALPVLFRQTGSIIEPISLISLLVFFGVSLRLLVVSTQTERNELVSEKLLNGEPASVLFAGAFAMVLGLTALSIGYSTNARPIRLERSFLVHRSQWSPQRTRLAALGLAALGAVGTILLVRSFGLTPISAKRFNTLEGGAQSRTGALTFLYFRMALLLRFALYILVIFRRQVAANYRLLVPALFLGAVFVPVYVNNRAGIALIVIDLLVIGYLGAGRFKASQILGAAVFVMGSALALLSVRGTRTSVIETTVFSRDLVDVSKTAQIVELDAGVLSGQTLYGWVLAQLPFETEAGSTWSNLGRFVWSDAYGRGGNNGVPAGLVGEMYLNVGWVGVGIGLFVFGWLLRKLYVTFRPYLGLPGAGLVYAIALPRFTIFALSNDIGTGVLKTAADVVPILVFLWFVGVPNREIEEPARSGLAVEIQSAKR